MRYSVYHEYHAVELNSLLPDEVLNWLTEKIGPSSHATWQYLPPKLFFYNKNHHLMFLLRWSEA